MKEIFVYIGSRAAESSTFYYVKEILDKTKNLVGEDKIKVNLFTASSFKINNCRACMKCFIEGRCYLNPIEYT